MNRQDRQLLSKTNYHTDIHPLLSPSTDDLEEFLGINTKEFERELVETAVTIDGSGESMFNVDILFLP